MSKISYGLTIKLQCSDCTSVQTQIPLLVFKDNSILSFGDSGHKEQGVRWSQQGAVASSARCAHSGYASSSSMVNSTTESAFITNVLNPVVRCLSKSVSAKDRVYSGKLLNTVKYAAFVLWRHKMLQRWRLSTTLTSLYLRSKEAVEKKKEVCWKKGVCGVKLQQQLVHPGTLARMLTLSFTFHLFSY